MRALEYPDGRRARRWVRVLEIVRRIPVRMIRRPLRFWWVVSDRVIFAWWWYGQGYEGAGRWRWYRALENAVLGVYCAFFFRAWAWVYEHIGE